MTRRLMVSMITATPAVLSGATRKWPEIEKLLASGNVKGKLQKSELPTPALCVDIEALDANIAKMAAYAKGEGRALRPHGKTHKCSEIALRCVRAGAVGACAAKISEAEAFAKRGVGGLLVTTAMVGQYRIERAVRLAARVPDSIFVVDNAQNVMDLNEAAKAARAKVLVAIDLNVSGRTGIQPGDAAVALAEQIAQLSNLQLKGIQAYAGHAAHVVGFEKRTAVSREAMGKAVETRQALVRKGMACDWLSGASTGTYNIDAKIDGVTELQPGSFLFMDVDYNRIGGAGDEVYRDFANSLTVVATVNSKPSDAVAVVDAGLKSFATDKPFGPAVKGLEGVTYAFAGDEHGKLDLKAATRAVNLGDRLELVVPHCDPTVNLYERIFVTRGEQVEAVWEIDARGMNM